MDKKLYDETCYQALYVPYVAISDTWLNAGVVLYQWRSPLAHH